MCIGNEFLGEFWGPGLPLFTVVRLVVSIRVFYGFARVPNTLECVFVLSAPLSFVDASRCLGPPRRGILSGTWSFYAEGSGGSFRYVNV